MTIKPPVALNESQKMPRVFCMINPSESIS